MNIKKLAYDAVVNRLRQDFREVQYKINQNLYSLKRLAEEQSRLKRERAVLMETIRSLDKKSQEFITK